MNADICLQEKNQKLLKCRAIIQRLNKVRPQSCLFNLNSTPSQLGGPAIDLDAADTKQSDSNGAGAFAQCFAYSNPVL